VPGEMLAGAFGRVGGGTAPPPETLPDMPPMGPVRGVPVDVGAAEAAPVEVDVVLPRGGPLHTPLEPADEGADEPAELDSAFMGFVRE
jgi:hypothetical protein